MSELSKQFGIYIHIPYCLQRCTYCDFATYVHSEIRPPEVYVAAVKKEISNKKNLFRHQQDKPIDTLYFGGGTPSLIPAHLIVELISELAKFGYRTGPNTEITIEINPATVDEKKLETYLAAGVNRFSVGAQSFSDRLLKMVNREHNSAQTIQTLELLKKYDLNFSFDVLFALPTQTVKELTYDIKVATEMGSRHISPYCLTVPEGHPLSKNRPLDDEQIEMFQIIHRELTAKKFHRYEISNYALSGFESQHNLLYWTDKDFWGLGLSAHSYARSAQHDMKPQQWGSRFWNINSFELYLQQMESESELAGLDHYIPRQIEHLQKHESLSDYCYTSLRLDRGLSVDKLGEKYGSKTKDAVITLAEDLVNRSLLQNSEGHYRLTENGVLISNQIFEKFSFSEDDL
ncbi:radical SAM family heme chaperone HemW [Pseudobdellovibrio exovorus]|uniref:Heme chaperone HemW n=1 Tax=Pseudobdellovibrio exovorus JSS TaxID=1184267 RepID=M4VU99_9BACT|nr:radical SAM family heme chaperone HemW [Pseudobdellovibrio exovorus]AGH96789.1 oxygen-independent coproporphyrinogen III oxidase, putative [Pseudobdellovibrio exovorus JSS]